jgi:hypothetical protein
LFILRVSENSKQRCRPVLLKPETKLALEFKPVEKTTCEGGSRRAAEAADAGSLRSELLARAPLVEAGPFLHHWGATELPTNTRG